MNWGSSLAHTGVLWLYWEAPKCKCNPVTGAHLASWRHQRGKKKNGSLTLQVPVLLRLQENTNAARLGWNSQASETSAFFSIDHLLLLTAVMAIIAHS